MGTNGLEPSTSRLSGVRSNHLSYAPFFGGDEEDRTPDPLRARQMLSQLSHTPITILLSQLLFYSILKIKQCKSALADQSLAFLPLLLRKEVIQPHLPIRLPCYDFTPVINPTFGCVLIAVRLQTSGVTDSHGVTGGVYKARERIHRSMLICDY